MMSEKPRNFGEFWPFYVREHGNPKNRRMHFTGTGLSFVCLAAAAITENPWFLLAAVLVGYGFAWVGHFFVEHNRPATFKYPFYSLMGDYKMFYLILNRQMDSEVERVRQLETLSHEKPH